MNLAEQTIENEIKALGRMQTSHHKNRLRPQSCAALREFLPATLIQARVILAFFFVSTNSNIFLYVEVYLRISCRTFTWLNLVNSFISGRKGRRAGGCVFFATSLFTAKVWKFQLSCTQIFFTKDGEDALA